MNRSNTKPNSTPTRRPAGRHHATLFAFPALLLILLTLALLSPSAAMAATHNWTNASSGPTTPWSDTANWSGGSAPPAGTSSTIINFGAGSGTYSSSNNISSTLRVNQLNITAGTVSLYGLGLSMRNAGATVDNTSGNLATINNPIALANDTEFHAAANITLVGALSGGSYKVTKTGSGTLQLASANNNFSSGLLIQRGTVAGGNEFRTFGSTSGTISLGDASVGADVALVANYGPSSAYPQTITVAGGAGTRTIRASHTSGSATFSGLVTLEKDVILNYTSTAGTKLAFTGGFGGTGSVTLKADGSKPVVVSGGIDSTGSITNSGSGTGEAQIVGDLGAGILRVVQNSSTSPMRLGGANISYVGDTKVLAGTLSVSNTCLGDSSAVFISDGAVLDLPHGSTDTVAGLYTNGVPLAGGTYDSTTLTGYITGTGSILVVLPSSLTLTYNAGANGTISGITPQTVAYGGSGSAVTAVPNTGYYFVNWSDSSTNATRTDTNVTYNITVTANFAPLVYTLTYNAGTGGTISGTATQTVAYAANGTTVTAVPNSGYHFVNWSDGLLTKARQEMSVMADTNFTANFAVDSLLTWAVGSETWDFSSPNWTNSSGAVTNYNIADLVQFNDDNTGGSEIAVTLNTAVNPTSVTVSNTAKNYTIGGSGGIIGTTGLDKDGTGMLTLLGTHTYTGKTTVSNGTLRLGNGSVSGVLTDSKIAVVTNATLEFAIPVSQTSTSSSVISGEGMVVKTGAGTAVLSANETYTGGTLVSDGTLQVGAGTSAGVLKGDLTNNATVHYYRSGSMIIPALHGNGEFVFEGITAAPMASGSFISLDNSANTNFTGPLSVAYARIGYNNGVTPEGLSAAHTITAVNLATLWLTNSIIGSDPFTNHFVIAGDGFYNYITQEGVLRFQGGVISGNVTMQNKSRIEVDTDKTGAISGIIEGDYVALEVGRPGGGRGTLTLSGANTYSGDTTISSGTLALSGTGSIASSPNIIVTGTNKFDVSAVSGGYNLSATQTLKGVGTVVGPATINGTLSPGLDNIGTLNFSSNQTLAGNCVMEIDPITPGRDQVVVSSGTLTYGGTLTVVNVYLGAADPSLGQSFKLFSASAYSGNFTATNLPTLSNPAVKWKWTPSNGTLAVVSTNTVNPTPTNLTYTVSGNEITLSWPESHTGWTVQWQTNTLGVGLSTNASDWHDLAGSTTTNQIVVTNSLANPTVFYRMKYTP